MKTQRLHNNSVRLKASQGFTLVELMITLVLSLMITYAIAQVLISSNRTSVSSDGMSQSQETGRFVMAFLANNIRQAGLDSITNDSRTTQAIISCADFPGLVGTISGNLACTRNSDLGATEANINALGTRGDRLAVAWIPPVPENAGAPAPNLIRDCTGATGYNEDETIINVFWVSADGNGMNNLMCQGHSFNGTTITRSNTAQAIANGVESMHLLFGEGINPLPPSGERNVGRYVNADDVANWSQVYSIKVSLMTRSLTEVTNESLLKRYVLLDSNPYLMTDAVNRQVFNTTFAINNYN